MNRDSSCIVQNFYASRGLYFVLLKLFILCSALSMSFEKSCGRVDNVLFSFVYVLIVVFLLTPSVHISTKRLWLYNSLPICMFIVHHIILSSSVNWIFSMQLFSKINVKPRCTHPLQIHLTTRPISSLPKMPCRIPMVPPLHPYLSTIKHGVVNRPRICIAPNNK